MYLSSAMIALNLIFDVDTSDFEKQLTNFNKIIILI